jgi:O-antigen/teichoic acid export membrane protein
MISIVLLPTIGIYATPGIPMIFSIIAIMVIPFTLTTGFLSSILLGMRKIKETSVITIIITVVSTIATVVVLILLGGGVKGLLILSLITGVVTFIFFVTYINKVSGFSHHISRSYVRDSTIFGFKPYVANALNFFNYRLSFFILGYFVGVLDVGYYSVAIGLAEMIWIIPSTVSYVLFPSVASTDSVSGGELTATSCRYVFFISMALCLGAAVLGWYVIQILYGDSFSPSYLPLVLLLPGILLNSVGSLTSSYLNGVGKVIYAPFINGTELVLTITLNLLLIPSFGILGASVATSVCYAYDGLMSMHYFRKHSNMNLRDVLLIKRKDISILLRKLPRF